MARTHIEVKKNNNENGVSLLRRFTRRMQESGILMKVKSKRYSERSLSKLKLKTVALKRINRRKDMEKLRKLGKLVERER